MARTLAAPVPLRPHLVDDDLDEDAVRRVLLDQHERLRRLLRALDAKAVAVIRSESQDGPNLQAALENATQALTDHMKGEERAIVTLLPRTQHSGRVIGVLREDHMRQRNELECMRRQAATADDSVTLALAVRAFVADVLLDMELEDRRYLSADGLMSART